MRKVLIGGILFLLSTVFIYAVSEPEIERLDANDKYKVIHVHGRILFKKSGADMKRGDIYVPGTLLEFITNESRAAIINKNKGRFVLTGNRRGKVKVLPAANNISSRSGALINIIDLKNHFEGRYVILDKLDVQVGKENFPMNEKQFFYLTYEHNGEEIAKKLPFEEDHIILDKNEIFKIDGEPIPVTEKEMTLYYREDGNGTKISSFIPVFPNMVDLKAEVSLILEIIDSEPIDKKQDEVAGHIAEFYGKPQVTQLNDWLEDEFGLK
ncbi:MAG: hypothetical protein HUJ25_08245 [Crocinitomicaceae bacterium]|nr:hypothetical protein [Crocinitomicaceae bacterium]